MAKQPSTGARIALGRVSEKGPTVVAADQVAGDVYRVQLPLCRGSVRLSSGGRTMFDGEVRPGMLRVTSPGERFRVERRTGAEALLLSVPGTLFRRVAAERDYRSAPTALAHVAPLTRPNPQVERLASVLLGADAVDPHQRPLFLEGAALALLAIAFSPREAESDGTGRGRLSDTELARCIDFADAHLDAQLDLTGWAASLGLPPGVFARRFRETTQEAPYAWFLNRRIDRAKLLLERPELALVDVALQVGFCSQSHFTEAFRRRTGAAPGRWRARCRDGSRQSGES